MSASSSIWALQAIETKHDKQPNQRHKEREILKLAPRFSHVDAAGINLMPYPSQKKTQCGWPLDRSKVRRSFEPLQLTTGARSRRANRVCQGRIPDAVSEALPTSW